MSEHEQASFSPVVKEARGQGRLCSVGSTMRAVFGLTLLAALCGFVWGLWEEVAGAPTEYASRKLADEMGPLQQWAVKAGKLIASLQGGEQEPEPTHAAAPEAPELEPLQLPEWEPTGPIEPPPDDRAEEPSESLGPEAHRPQPMRTDPVKPPPRRRTVRWARGLDPKADELLDKALAAHETAWKYYNKSGPDAPAAGRDAATKQAIIHLKRARDLYRALLERKLPDDVRKVLEGRVTQVQRALYWCTKFSGVKRAK